MLDDLRRAQLLPLSTVFVMITAEATYAKVNEAAESALDGYLIKPHTATALADRLQQARRRKKVLKDVFEALDDGRFDDAARLCLERFAQRSEFWGFCARVGAEVLLHQGRNDEARQVYEAMLAAQPGTPWARLGVARAQAAANETAKALATLRALVGDQPSFVDAFDVLGRLQVDTGDAEAALETLRRAAQLTPGSVGRLQKVGMLASYLGQHDEAARSLERAVSLGISSKAFDAQSLVLLALARFQQKDSKGLQRCVDNLAHALTRTPDSTRLERFGRIAQVLNLTLLQRADDAAALLARVAEDLREEGFDLEAGFNLLALLAQLAAAGHAPPAADDWVDAIGLRHATSKAVTELLVRVAGAHEPYAERLRACNLRITQVGEESLAHSLAGNPAAAVRGLMEHGRVTLNGKLFDNARSVLQRHHAKIADAARLMDEVEMLRARHGGGAGKLPLGDGGRKPGAIALRTSTPLPAAEVSPAEA